MALFPLFILFIGTFCVLLMPSLGHFPVASAEASDQCQTPELPSSLKSLDRSQMKCVFIIFTWSKLFGEPKVKEQFEKQAKNDWEKVIKRPNLRHAMAKNRMRNKFGRVRRRTTAGVSSIWKRWTGN